MQERRVLTEADSLNQKWKMFKEELDKIDISMEYGKAKCFISIGYPTERATVVCGLGNSKETAFMQAKNRAVKCIKEKGMEPPWLKVDYVIWEKELKCSELEDLLSAVRKFYFEFGIAFDHFYNCAFLQQEINANCLMKYENLSEFRTFSPEIISLAGKSTDKESQKKNAKLNYANIDTYIKKYKKAMISPDLEKVDIVTIFRTKSYFFDENKMYEIEEEELCTNRRKLVNISKDDIIDLTEKNARYLQRTMHEDGKFVYGYFSCFNREIEAYNIIRHALAVDALAETYRLTEDESFVHSIKTSLKYMVENYIYELDDYAFVVDHSNHEEIKLGGLAVCILTIIKCLELEIELDDREYYYSIIKKIGRGIIYMQNPATGQFVHVLRYPDLEIVEQFRIIYYSGEAAYALCRLYQIDKNDDWMKAVKRAFNYFIKNDYWKNSDHWLAYCTNEITEILPEDCYFEFGLKNALHNIDYVINRNTTWATFLETLMAAYNMIEKMKRIGKKYLLKEYDLEKLKMALEIRMKRQLDGIFFPELAMYFKSPETILYGVFVKHYSFRVRNDDVAHHISGYCHYLKDFMN